MGTWMDQVARGWLLYELTGQPFQLGLVGFLRVFPLIFLSPIAGTMADRYGRKTQLITAQTINALANVVLGMLILQGGVHPWHVYATGLINSTVQVFQQPARQAMVPESVDRAYLTNAIALNSIAFNMSRSLGPAVAGAIIAWIGAGGSYIVQGGIYMVSSIWTAQLSLPNQPPVDSEARAHEARRTFVGSTVHGWRYILGHETIRTALFASAVVSFFGFSVSSLLPVFAKDILEAGPQGQGLLLTAMGVGAVVSAFLVATIGDNMRKGPMMMGGIALYGVAAMAFAGSHWLLVSMALMLVIGICNVASTTLIQTVLQSESAPEMRGRVMGAYQQHHVLIASGGLVAGGMATFWPAQLTVAILGAACVVAAVLFLIAIPHVRTIR
jgi:MFS family permease